MFKKTTVQLAHILLAVALLLGLLGLGQAVLAGEIDSTDKYAWGTNAGWINFRPSNGGVTVYTDHLEGYAYGENIGWIRLGTYTAGSPHTYANDAAGTYGVNNDGVGNLSGYAWGTVVGWINFAPTHGGVTIDPMTGEFDGYAYGENIGWLRVQGTALDNTAYKVKAGPTADPTDNLVTGYDKDIAAIITTRQPNPAASAGLAIGNNSFLNDAGDGIVFGHDGVGGVSTSDLPDGVADRWARSWDFDVHDDIPDGGTTGGKVDITFDFGDAGFGITPVGDAADFRLLKRSGTTGPFADITSVSGATVSISGDQVIFTGVDVAQLGSFFTIGSTTGTLPVTLSYFLATPSGDGLHLEWSTATENGNAGFNLYVENGAGRQQLNLELIPSAVIDAVEPQDYRYDVAGMPGEIFYMEQVDVQGGREMYGPFALGVPFGSRQEADPIEQENKVYLPSILKR